VTTGEAVLVIFGGFAASFALMTLLPTRRDERWERLERRHWRRVERSLRRVVELLEQRTADAEPVARDRSPVEDDEAP
jgi:hypothetical protein